MHLAADDWRERASWPSRLDGPSSAEAHYPGGASSRRAALGPRRRALRGSVRGGAWPPRARPPAVQVRRALEERSTAAARAAYELDDELSADGEALFRLGLFDLEAGELEAADERLAAARRRFTVPRTSRACWSRRPTWRWPARIAPRRRCLEEAVQRAPQRASRTTARLCREDGDVASAERFEAALTRPPERLPEDCARHRRPCSPTPGRGLQYAPPAPRRSEGRAAFGLRRTPCWGPRVEWRFSPAGR